MRDRLPNMERGERRVKEGNCWRERRVSGWRGTSRGQAPTHRSIHPSIHLHRAASWKQVNPRDCKPQGKGRNGNQKPGRGMQKGKTE